LAGFDSSLVLGTTALNILTAGQVYQIQLSRRNGLIASPGKHVDHENGMTPGTQIVAFGCCHLSFPTTHLE
jgi:hypothetical protein